MHDALGEEGEEVREFAGLGSSERAVGPGCRERGGSAINYTYDAVDELALQDEDVAFECRNCCARL